MDKLIIANSPPLFGEVSVSGAKNSALPILFSTLLAEGTHVFSNVPKLKDIDSTLLLLSQLGVNYEWKDQRLFVTTHTAKNLEAHYDIVRKMRASILCLGPLLAKYHEASVSLPGGCAIGTRPINLHLDIMKALGAEIELNEGYVKAYTNKNLQGATFLFDSATVGGTENAMMAACLAEGTTILENAAKEPEIIDLGNYLIKMGAQISGLGSSIITIKGVSSLKPAEHTIIPDRIEAGTLLIASAITGGNITINHCVPEDLDPLLFKLKESGSSYHTGKDWIQIKNPAVSNSVDITTAPHPQFPTDLQAQFMALMTNSIGTSVITETIFENRFMHVQELIRLNADITPKSHVAVVRGRPGLLTGAPVMATDLRASAGLIIAGLAAKGETIVNRIYHLDRGYEFLEKKLSALGAPIKRV